MFLECGTCNECCQGNLTGEAYGVPFGDNKPCSFLINQKCSIYKTRPDACKKFQCGWSQDLFVDWMKPELSGVLVSVEVDKSGKQFLKAIVIPNKVTDSRAIPYLNEWVEKNKTYLIITGSDLKNENKMIDTSKIAPLGDLEPFVVMLNNFNRKDLAEEVLEVFGQKSFIFAQFDNVASCFFKIRNYDKTIEYCLKALASTSNPQEIYTIKSNLINAYNHANYPELALKYIDQCQATAPDDIDIILEKAYSMFLLNQKPQAEQILRDTLKNFSGQLPEECVTKIKFNLGTYHLYRDEFQQGLKLFLEEGAKMKLWNSESVFARDNVFELLNSGPNKIHTKFIKWSGRSEPGSTLIIQAEAGIGDEIINVRFIKKIEQMGINVYWFQPGKDRNDLVEVFTRNGVKVLQNIESIKLPSQVYYAQSMHLPILLNLDYEDLWSEPYLTVNDVFKDKWNWVKKGKPSIGIRWQGNPMYDHDLHRSFPLQPVLDLFEGMDVNLYSLQRDYGLEELSDNIVDLSSKLVTWEDTLGAMSNMDLIITSCTSVAHASAACGFRTVVMVPISAYYVWSHSADQSPWYGDNVKIIRQQSPRVWDESIEELRNYINKIL